MSYAFCTFHFSFCTFFLETHRESIPKSDPGTWPMAVLYAADILVVGVSVSARVDVLDFP
jgi:hypothetical protein